MGPWKLVGIPGRTGCSFQADGRMHPHRPRPSSEDPNTDSNNTSRPHFVFSPPPTKERAGEKEKRGVGEVDPNKPPTFNSQTEPNISHFNSSIWPILTPSNKPRKPKKKNKKNKSIRLHLFSKSPCRSGSLSLLRSLSSPGDPALDLTVLIAPSTLPSTSDLDTRRF